MIKKALTSSTLRRYLFLLVGLFVNALGISLITKADIGTSPISGIPYTLSLGFAPTLGAFTFWFSLGLIVIQLLIMRRAFPRRYWLQIPVAILLSVFIDLTMAMLGGLRFTGYLSNIFGLAVGCLILGAGVYMEVAAGVVMLPGECTVKALTLLGNTDFGKTKVAFDFSLALIALLIGLALFHAPAGIREGTFVSALTVGLIARAIDRAVGRRIQVLF